MICFQKIARDLHVTDWARRLRTKADRYAHFLRHDIGNFANTFFIRRDDAIDESDPLLERCPGKSLESAARGLDGLFDIFGTAAGGHCRKGGFREGIDLRLLAGVYRFDPRPIDINLSVVFCHGTPVRRTFRSCGYNQHRKQSFGR